MYDVIIVGARCAGSSLALLLARHGHRVLVVDKASFPSDTISTHYLHTPAVARLKRWGLLDALLATKCPPITDMTFTYDEYLMRGRTPACEGVTEAYAPRRTVLDALLVETARAAGAEVREGFSVRELLTEGGRVTGVVGRCDGEETIEARARIVIGADGRHSAVARLAQAEMYNVIPSASFLYYSYWSGLDRGFEMRLKDGLGLLTFPTHDELSLIAVEGRRETFDDFRYDMAGSFQRAVEQVAPDVAEEMRRGVQAERLRGTANADNYYRRAHGPGWALVGDAGHHKDPVLGHGINHALLSAELLAEAVHAGLSEACPMEESLAGYERSRDSQTEALYRLDCEFGELAPTTQLVRIFRALHHKPEHQQAFFDMFAGLLPAEEFFSFRNLAALLRKSS